MFYSYFISCRILVGNKHGWQVIPGFSKPLPSLFKFLMVACPQMSAPWTLLIFSSLLDGRSLGQVKLEKLMSFKILYEEVIVEILLRLPVKSLVRFKCVSKRWLSLISDPRFAEWHFKRASEHAQRVLFSSRTEVRFLDFNELFRDSTALKQLVVPFKQPNRRVRILGTCNGLVCVSLYNHKDFYLWNPSTAVYRKLPDPWIKQSGDTHTYRDGFGYDLSSDDYKILVATCHDDSLVTAAQVLVFSLKTNSWRHIQHPGLGYPYACIFSSRWESAGTLCNGALHWKVHLAEPYFCDSIIAFDLSEEKFRKVPMPMDEGIYIHDLRNLGGRLYFTCCRNLHSELWRMMEYGAQESWARLYTVSFYQHPVVPLCWSGDQLVAFYLGMWIDEVYCWRRGSWMVFGLR